MNNQYSIRYMENKQIIQMSMLNPSVDIKIPEPVESPIRGKEYCS